MSWLVILAVVGLSVTVTLALVGLAHALMRSRAGAGTGLRRAAGPQLFTLQSARLTCDGGSVIRVGQPCRIHFQWGIMNGARSLVLHRTKLLVQKDRGAFFPVASLPELEQPKAASYERAISGDIARVYAWDKPGIYYMKARVKAALAGTPFTYQFEVRGRVKVMAAHTIIESVPVTQPAPPASESAPLPDSGLVLEDPNTRS